MSPEPIMLIAGWGYPAPALAGLSEALSPRFMSRSIAAHQLIARKSQRHKKMATSALSAHANGLASIIKEQKGKPTLIGWSLGGLVALEIAAHCPELVSGLVLIASAPKFCASAGFAQGIPIQNIRAIKQGLTRDIDATLAKFYRLAAAPFRAALPMPQLCLPGTSCQDELTAGLNYLLETDLRPELDRIQSPVLMLHGKEDRVISWQAADYIRQLLPSSRLRLYDDIGHDIPLREPLQLAAEILNFCNEML